MTEKSITPAPGFGIYVHWPFCAAKCPYCDFNSHVRRAVDHGAWRAGLLAELDHMASLDASQEVTSVFFGGGTPSLMEPETVAAMLERITARWQVATDVEVTLEANPQSADAERFAGYRAAGVNRVSLGVQSLRDDALRFLGRLHTADEALKALDLARRNFERVSFDLIYARPGQRSDDWFAELKEALALGPDHLSLYQLTIEPGTPFFDLHAKGALTVPDEDTAAALYALTQETAARAGLAAYEVSNHARPGAESRHNLIYWRYGDYAGVGPGAHGRLTAGGEKRAFTTLRKPEAWLEAVAAHGHGIDADEILAPEDQAAELLLMGLRLAEGIDPARYEALAGRALPCDRLASLEEDGLLFLENGRLVASPKGRLVLNRVIAELAG